MRAFRLIAAVLIVPGAVAMSWLTPSRAGSAAADGKPACTADGTALSIAARGKKFDKDCLAAPAEVAFTIEFDNQDAAVPHNVAIYDTANGNRPLFKGEVIFGPRKITYSVPAQPSGTYQFRCDPHDDTMLGTFVVGDGSPSASTAPSSTTTTTGPFGLPL